MAGGAPRLCSPGRAIKLKWYGFPILQPPLPVSPETRLLSLLPVHIILHPRLRLRLDRLLCPGVPYEPVVMNVAQFFRDAADLDGRRRSAERVVVDFNPRSGDRRPIFPVAAAVHVETVAERFTQFDVVPGRVAAAGPAGSGRWEWRFQLKRLYSINEAALMCETP